MLARKRGIISGPRVHTCASVVSKKKEDPVDSDSDATLILDNDIKSPVPAKNKTRGCNKKQKKKESRKPLLPKPMCSEKVDFPEKQRTKEENYMSHFAYACKMRYPLNLVLESWEYLWFY